MNIKSLISLLQYKKAFFDGHPDIYKFVIDNFRSKQEIGTTIDIKMTKPSGEVSFTSMSFSESDITFLDAVSSVLNDRG